MSREERIRAILRTLPNTPGVYRFYDEKGSIIYIGKAINLKSRVSSYFQNPDRHNSKTKLLIKKIDDIKITIVNNEREALLLENALIKENQPRYNILLKDDKTYPWVCVTHEEFPRIYITRKYQKNRGTYFGPFTSKQAIDSILLSIKRILPYRTCKMVLKEGLILQNKYRVCLEYHIKNCKAPCVNLQSKEEYNETVGIIKSLLRGNTNQIIASFESQLKKYEDKLEFESAEKVFRNIQLIKEYKSKNSIVNPSLGEIDSLCYVEKYGKSVVNYMQIREGTIILSINREVKNPLDVPTDELLARIAETLKEEYSSQSKNLICNTRSHTVENVYPRVETPVKGEKSSIIRLGEINARKHLANLVDSQGKEPEEVLTQLQHDLKLNRLPYRIECIDNSNTLGTFPVSSCVVFINGKPKKSEYRIFNVQEVTGPDDYKTMREIIGKKFSSARNAPLPDLLIVDGGKGQLNAVLSTLKEKGQINQFDVIAIAEKKEEIYVPRETRPIVLNKNSPTLQLIQQLRDEAHRFGLKHHTKKRDTQPIKSTLLNLKGLGPKSVQKLYAHFHSIESMKRAKNEEIEKIIGPSKTRILVEFLQHQTH